MYQDFDFCVKGDRSYCKVLTFPVLVLLGRLLMLEKQLHGFPKDFLHQDLPQKHVQPLISTTLVMSKDQDLFEAFLQFPPFLIVPAIVTLTPLAQALSIAQGNIFAILTQKCSRMPQCIETKISV